MTKYIIDSHAHVLREYFGEEQKEVIARARKDGVVQLICPGIELSQIKELLELGESYSQIFVAVGVHPHQANMWSDDSGAVLKEAARHPKVVAIGECGLDFFYNNSDRQSQIFALKAQIQLAKELDKPIIIHCRDAWEEMFSILEKVTEGKITGVFHCFTGNRDMLPQIEQLDFYVSFSGILTFPNARSIQDAAIKVPENRIIVETDCPFLAPQAMRGKRNEPSYIWMVAEQLAKLRNVPLIELSRMLCENTRRLFQLPEPDL